MKAYQAISIHVPAGGWPAPGSTLTVLSVHNRAVNLSAPGGQILSLVHPHLGNGPGAIVLPEPWPLPLEAGATFLVEDGRLTGAITVALQTATPWTPPLAPQHLRPDMGRAVRALAALGSRAGILPAALAALQYEMIPRPAGLEGALFDLALQGIALLRRQEWETAARRLAGLGPGLTPSGDDLLCGYLLCLHRAGSANAGALAAAIQTLPDTATTPLSTHFLRWACQGVAGEHHLTWLDSLLTGAGDAHLAPLLAHGATSGADWAAGALLAASTL